MKKIILLMLGLMLAGCELKDFIETDSMKRPIKVVEWNEDGSIHRIIDTGIITINIGDMMEKENNYAINNPDINGAWTRVSRNPDIKYQSRVYPLKYKISLWEDGERVKNGRLVK